MPVIAIIGAQWGDEGKGKIVDLVAEKAGMVVRFSGGDNAGHTVINPYGEFKLHLIPSGLFYPKVLAVIGNGVVVNPSVLLEEIDDLNRRGVDTSRLFLSDRAHLIMPYHLLLDELEEKCRGGGAIGTTRKGIGPAYSDKTSRVGIRVGDLLEGEVFRERLQLALDAKNLLLSKVYGAPPLSLEEIYEQYSRYGERLAPYIRETTQMVHSALERKELVILEGAQGALLDLDFGTYPYTTSSSPLSGGGCVGAGVGPTRVDAVLGVFKAYTTRVGEGPMPTELKDEVGESIRTRAHEFGTTTGRARRCGWFDGVAARFSNQINGFTGVALTRLDVLDEFSAMKVCVGYKLKGGTVDHFPAHISALARCEPVYEELPGWMAPTSDIRSYDELPQNARCYIERLEEIIACPIKLVSVGPSREQTIERAPFI